MHRPLTLNDPAELLEVFDAHGRATGVAKRRDLVHLDGDWHQCFHCWVTRPGADGCPEVVLQRRSAAKDTFPGLWDASAAGHWGFGEAPWQAARELAEELGVRVAFDRLRWIGRERMSRRFPAHGITDREFHQVYHLDCSAPLATYHPNPAEVAGLAAVRGHDLVELAAGRVAAIVATDAVDVLPDGTLTRCGVTITRSDLVRYSAARLGRLLRAARQQSYPRGAPR